MDVRNGVFNVLLGQTTAINSACLTSDAYLELLVNGETLAPRERLTSVLHAVEASALSADATTRGDLAVNGTINMQGNGLVNSGSLYALPGGECPRIVNIHHTR